MIFKESIQRVAIEQVVYFELHNSLLTVPGASLANASYEIKMSAYELLTR